MTRQQHDLRPPAISAEHERWNHHVGFVYSIYYLLQELEFLSDADRVRRAWRGEIEGVLTWPDDGYNDVYAFGEIDDAVDYFLTGYSTTKKFRDFSNQFDIIVFDRQFQSDSGFCDVERYLASSNFLQLSSAAQALQTDLTRLLAEKGINIERLRAKIIAALEELDK